MGLAKRIETCSWYTHYRGPMVIHAAKNYPKWAKKLATTDAFRQGLGCHLGPETLPLGVGLCVVRIVACVKTTELHKLAAIGFQPQVNERMFGNFEEGRYAWALEHLYDFIEPVPAKGAQGLWTWPINKSWGVLKLTCT